MAIAKSVAHIILTIIGDKSTSPIIVITLNRAIDINAASNVNNICMALCSLFLAQETRIL